MALSLPVSVAAKNDHYNDNYMSVDLSDYLYASDKATYSTAYGVKSTRVHVRIKSRTHDKTKSGYQYRSSV